MVISQITIVFGLGLDPLVKNLDDPRVLENRLRQLQALREFEVDDSFEPTQGILA